MSRRNMEYNIHGKVVLHDGSECGIYKFRHENIRQEYAVMDVGLLVNAVNNMSLDKAIEAVTALKNQAAEQAQWKSTPQNLGYPILRQTSGTEPTSINEVRENIDNTRRFADDILKALRGE